MQIVILPLLVALLGLILYFGSTKNEKLSQVGKLLFIVGAAIALYFATLTHKF